MWVASCGNRDAALYPANGVSFTDVHFDEDSFWGERQKTARTVTLPYCLGRLKDTQRIQKFVWAGMHNADTSLVFAHVGEHYDDSDVYKVLEGVAYSLQNYPDPELEAYADSLIGIIAKAQEPDGYLMTARTMDPAHPHPRVGAERWKYINQLSHELYMLGHLCESAVAYYYATGKTAYLDVARKYADCVCDAIGPEETKLHCSTGHQEAEIGLVKLYLVTGDRKYLDEAEYFLDVRYESFQEFKDDSTALRWHQAFQPVVDQREAWGHVVKALYMYSGMADIAAITGRKDYTEAIDAIWSNICSRKMYLTGGMGSRHGSESFEADYDLPNDEAYCETCAAIAGVFFNYRMFLLHRQSKYIDLLEQMMYNAALDGISLEGDSFFYVNPLESSGGHSRQPWYSTACCPSNLSRFIPSLSQYMYATEGDRIFVNLYQSSDASFTLGRKRISIRQETDYPWGGDVLLSVDGRGEFDLRLRIPGWLSDAPLPGGLYSYCCPSDVSWTVAVNGVELETGVSEDGYVSVFRKWKPGDTVELHMDMKARTVRVRNEVEADRNRIAVVRGPLVYCMEEVDNPGTDPRAAALDAEAAIDTAGISVSGRSMVALCAENHIFIPYFAWAHRGAGKMEVFLEIEL